MKLWQRYLLLRFSRALLFTLSLFYGLYVLIDYASHATALHKGHHVRTVGEMALTYGAEFCRRCELLLPFSVLLATLYTLLQMNRNRELVALLGGGISLQRLLRPLLLASCLLVLLQLLLAEWVLPVALRQLRRMEERHREGGKSGGHPRVKVVHLADGSRLLYREYDPERGALLAVYWVRSLDEIYRMEWLEPGATPPQGHYVDRLARNDEGALTWKESTETLGFEEMTMTDQERGELMSLPEELPLSSLLRSPFVPQRSGSEGEAQWLSALHYKLAMPWLALFAFLLPAPLCVRFSRTFHPILLYAAMLIALFILYLAMGAFSVLAQRQVLPPAAALWSPLALAFAFAAFRYARLSTR